MRILADKRFLILVSLLALVTISFWSVSRYPALDEKAAMGGDSPIQGIAFDQVLQVTSEQSWIQQSLYSFVNWLETNRKGMIFGLLFAVIMMTGMPLFSSCMPTTGFGASLLGAAVGAPLGICVNCAAPVAAGMRSAGARLEMALATMFSSPSLNFVVLTMMFTMLPWYLGIIKLAATAVFVFVCLPLLCRVVFRREAVADPADNPWLGKALPGQMSACEPSSKTWWEAARWTASGLLRSTGFLGIRVVPLMLLAGLLGAVLIVLVPWRELVVPYTSQAGTIRMIKTMVLLAAVGAFLPVPMAFDVIMVGALYAVGLPSAYCAILLFTLGIHSVYSAFVLGRFVSWRMAGTLYVIVVVFGLGCGWLVNSFEPYYLRYQERVVVAELKTASQAKRPPLPMKRPPMPLASILEEFESKQESRSNYSLETRVRDIHLEGRPFSRRNEVDLNSPLYQRHEAQDFGLHSPTVFSIRSLVWRFQRNRPIATGDVHNDGWPDVVIGSDHELGGLEVFVNMGGWKFMRQEADLGRLTDANINTVALLDLNDDGWLDILFSTFRQGNYIYRNDSGQFLPENLISLGTIPDTSCYSFSAGDFDRDGDLDLMLGNFTFWHRVDKAAPVAGRNVMLWQQPDNTFRREPLPGQPGYTLSTLATDFDHDGDLDLIVGNDWKPPEVFYEGDSEGGFREIKKSDGTIPITTSNTMSIASADVDNDLKFELFFGGISFGNRRETFERTVRAGEIAFEYGRTEDRRLFNAQMHAFNLSQRSRGNAARWRRLDPQWLRQDTILWLYAKQIARMGKPEWISNLPERETNAIEVMHRAFLPPYEVSDEEAAEEIPQTTLPNNVFLVPDLGGGFEDRAEAAGLHRSDWTWNAKFADLDQDGWQDLYVVNGMWTKTVREPNHYFRNMGEIPARFENHTSTSGLSDYLTTSSYSYVDLDADGDLDIVTIPVQGPIRIFENRNSRGNAVALELRDERGNRFGIGAKVIVEDDLGIKRIREIQPGGGYISYDPPVAHFGLGPAQSIKRVRIEWQTGEATEFEASLAANHFYQITRSR